MKRIVILASVALILSGCAAFKSGSSVEEQEAAAGSVATLTEAVGALLPWPWNLMATGIGTGALGYLAGKRGLGVKVTTTPPK